jgi:hypothetical protein
MRHLTHETLNAFKLVRMIFLWDRHAGRAVSDPFTLRSDCHATSQMRRSLAFYASKKTGTMVLRTIDRGTLTRKRPPRTECSCLPRS